MKISLSLERHRNAAQRQVSHHLDHKFPKYGLFAYSEGRFTSEVRNMHFNGIPVLFIPGNAGSPNKVCKHLFMLPLM
nr:unnamed protein product [Callosobruchus chinensis]